MLGLLRRPGHLAAASPTMTGDEALATLLRQDPGLEIEGARLSLCLAEGCVRGAHDLLASDVGASIRNASGGGLGIDLDWQGARRRSSTPTPCRKGQVVCAAANGRPGAGPAGRRPALCALLVLGFLGFAVGIVLVAPWLTRTCPKAWFSPLFTEWLQFFTECSERLQSMPSRVFSFVLSAAAAGIDSIRQAIRVLSELDVIIHKGMVQCVSVMYDLACGIATSCTEVMEAFYTQAIRAIIVLAEIAMDAIAGFCLTMGDTACWMITSCAEAFKVFSTLASHALSSYSSVCIAMGDALVDNTLSSLRILMEAVSKCCRAMGDAVVAKIDTMASSGHWDVHLLVVVGLTSVVTWFDMTCLNSALLAMVAASPMCVIVVYCAGVVSNLVFRLPWAACRVGFFPCEPVHHHEQLGTFRILILVAFCACLLLSVYLCGRLCFAIVHACRGQPRAAPAKPAALCAICLTSPVEATFVHGLSGHTVCCMVCAREVQRTGGHCPICRQPLQAVIRNYLA